MDVLVWALMFVSVAVLLIAATIVYLSNDSKLQRTIAWLLYVCALWTFASGVQSVFVSSALNLLLVRLTFVSAVVMSYVIFLTVVRLTGGRAIMATRAAMMTTIVALLLSISPLVVTGVVDQGGSTIPVRGTLYPFVIVVLAAQLCAAIVYMYTKTRLLREGRLKRQYRVVLWGITAGTLVGIVTNIILPNIEPGLHSSRFAWAATLIWAAVLFFAVVRHHFLDIRLAIVRSVGYVLSLLALTACYYAVLIVGSKLLGYNDIGAATTSVGVNIFLIVVLSTAFGVFKRFFDKLTDRIFYHKEYASDAFIARLGEALTSSTEIELILDAAASEIMRTIKVGSIAFVVFDTSEDTKVYSHGKMLAVDGEQLREFGSVVLGHKERAWPIDSVYVDDPSIMTIVQKLRQAGFVIALRLSNQTGYVLIGNQLGFGFSRKDIGVLGAISDQIAIAIQNAQSLQEVHMLNAGLERKITAATRELRASNKRLVELDATKDEFVSMASHQLRTPLTSIKGYLSMVLEGDVGTVSPQQRQLLNEAYASSERMVHLIGDFLNVSRLQTGKFMIEFRETDLAALVAQEIDSIRQIAESHGMSILYRAPRLLPRLYIDDNKIRQVVMNFIDNAIYYSPESTASIVVRLSVEEGYVVLRVIDKGMGVPAGVQKQLFGKFFRADNARKQRPDGTGIGLFLAKKIIDGHGGKVIVESTEGKGSTFGFRLPIKKLSNAPSAEAIDTKNTP